VAAQKPRLTLAEAIARSNRVQPNVISASGNIRNAQARVRSASGAYLPNLTLSGTRADNAGPQFDQVLGQFTTKTTQSFGGTVAVAKLQAGRGIRPDSLRSLVTLGSAQLQLVNAQTALATAEANLGRLVGEDGPVGAVDDSSLYQVLPVIDTAAIRAEAIANAPAVKSAEAQASSARAAITVAKAGYYPTLNLSGSTSLNGSRRTTFTYLQSRGLSLGLNWAIFNRFQREQGVVASQVAAEVADANAAEARRQVLSSLTAALASLDAARIRIGISQTSVQAGQEDLRVQQERYRLGAGTIVDVLTSQEALSQAEVDGVTARFDYVRARAQISALIGRTL